jgi:hypothetical protein
MNAPGYWMHETSGVLRPVVEAYLHGGPMTEADIARVGGGYTKRCTA